MSLGPFSAKDHVIITSLGLEFAIAVSLGTAGGLWIDTHFGIKPWGTVVGVLFGFFLGMYIVVKESYRLSRQKEDKEGSKKDGSI